jgi:hypothetical protein
MAVVSGKARLRGDGQQLGWLEGMLYSEVSFDGQMAWRRHRYSVHVIRSRDRVEVFRRYLPPLTQSRVQFWDHRFLPTLISTDLFAWSRCLKTSTAQIQDRRCFGHQISCDGIEPARKAVMPGAFRACFFADSVLGFRRETGFDH